MNTAVKVRVIARQKYAFATNLKAYRTQHEMTQEQVADRLGVSEAFISILENHAEKTPSYEVLVGLCQLFGVEPSDLMLNRDSEVSGAFYA